MMPIQSRDIGEKSLLPNYKKQRAIEPMKHKEKFTKVTEATELGERPDFPPWHHQNKKS
jgi:hypothetical protein